MYATQFSRNFQNNQHGLPGKISRLQIIASFTTKLCTAFTYSLLHQLRIRNCSNSVSKRCVLNVCVRAHVHGNMVLHSKTWPL